MIITPQVQRMLDSYVRRIRNYAKRQYAERYTEWLLAGSVGQQPERGKLGAMGEQSVRLAIAEILAEPKLTEPETDSEPNFLD